MVKLIVMYALGDKDMKKFSSQGQKRTAVLSLKLAELELLKEIKSYEYQIDEYEAQIEEYEEQIESYEEFIKNNEGKNAEFNTKVNEILDLKEKIFNMEKALNRTIAFKAQDIETKLYSDRKYQQILLSLILSDTRGGNAVIKYLNLILWK